LSEQWVCGWNGSWNSPFFTIMHHHSPLMIHRFTRITQYEPSLTIINYR
jgi:hypothetical protein